MTSEALNGLTIIGAGVLAIFVFGGLSVRHNVPAIEQDLTDRVKTELRKSRMSWANVELSGRDLTISGVAPDAAARDAALEIAQVWGVRTVETRLDTVEEYVGDGVTPPAGQDTPTTVIEKQPTTAKASQFRTRVTVDNRRLILDGAAPDERSRRAFVELAQENFSVATVEAQLQTRDNAPEDWLQAMSLGLEIADRLVIGEVNLVDRSMHVMGITATAGHGEQIERILSESLPEGYSGTAETGVRAELDAVLRTSPELASRLARRAQVATTRVDLPEPRVLSEPACEAEFRQTLGDSRILYATASARLTPDSIAILDTLAAVLKRCSGLRIAIHGHTDDQGEMENNLSLSQRRAESVMQHLVSRGISLGRMTAQGFGEEQPLVPNVTASDRAVNRRIEFKFESG